MWATVLGARRHTTTGALTRANHLSAANPDHPEAVQTAEDLLHQRLRARCKIVPAAGRTLVADRELVFHSVPEVVSWMSADISPQSHDVIFKHLGPLFAGESLRALGIDLPPATAVLPTELPQVSVRMHAIDYLLRLRDGSCLHLEFQSTSEPDDIARFLVYDAHLYERDGAPIRTVVIYSGGVRRARDQIDAGGLLYRIENVYLSSLDGDRHLADLQQRSRSGGLDAEDALEVALLILMGRREHTAQEVALEAARLAEALPGEFKRLCQSAVVGFAERYLTEDEFRAVAEVEPLAGRLSEMLAEGEARGEARGEAKGKAESVLLVLTERFGPVPEAVVERIRNEHEVTTLGRWMLAALRAASLAEFDHASRE